MADVTVLMTTYNAMPYLREAVDSIRGQSLQDWKFVIVNDGSQDDTQLFLDSLNDPRIHVFHQENGGTAVASNFGLTHCDTEFIARLDADDIAHPTRLEKQLAFLRNNPAVGLVGSQARQVGTHGVGKPLHLALDHTTIDADLLAGRHAVVHSSIMMRAEQLRKIGGYWSSHGMYDAWDMFLRMAEVSHLANLDEVLTDFRLLPGSINGKQLHKLRLRIDYATELAKARRSNAPLPDYDAFLASRQQAHAIHRFATWANVYALTQYRLATIDLLGNRPWRGRLRLAWSALWSPSRTVHRLSRIFQGRQRTQAVPTSPAGGQVVASS